MMLILTLFISLTVQAKTLTVAVIDTGFDFKSTWPDAKTKELVRPKLCKMGHKDFVQPKKMTLETIEVDGKINRKQIDNPDYLFDNHGHGTHIAGIIGKYAGNIDYCLVIIKFYDPKYPSNNLDNLIKSFKYAIDLKVDIINFSGGGVNYSKLEKKVVINALNKGITVIVAAGNERSDIDLFPYYPAMYDSRIIAVENWALVLDKTTNKLTTYISSSSNYSNIGSTDGGEYGEEVTSLLPNNSYGQLTGTSQATAIRTGKVLKKYSDAYNINIELILERIKRTKNMV